MSPEFTITGGIIQKNMLTVTFLDGKIYSLDDSQPTFAKLKEAMRAKDGEKARSLVNAAEKINVWSEGLLTVDKEDNVLYDGHKIDPKMHDRILKMIREGSPLRNLILFLDNLYENPRAESIADLYEFMQANNLPLTEDGHFLAFKTVRNDFKDHHTGMIDNSIGNIVKIDRDKCQLDRHQTCSTGLHFCGHEYLGVMPSGVVLLVKINPRDITSIPSDYNNRKGRCCQYEVIAAVRHGEKLEDVFKKATISTATIKAKHKPEGPKLPNRRKLVAALPDTTQPETTETEATEEPKKPVHLTETQKTALESTTSAPRTFKDRVKKTFDTVVERVTGKKLAKKEAKAPAKAVAKKAANKAKPKAIAKKPGKKSAKKAKLKPVALTPPTRSFEKKSATKKPDASKKLNETLKQAFVPRGTKKAAKKTTKPVKKAAKKVAKKAVNKVAKKVAKKAVKKVNAKKTAKKTAKKMAPKKSTVIKPMSE